VEGSLCDIGPPNDCIALVWLSAPSRKVSRAERRPDSRLSVRLIQGRGTFPVQSFQPIAAWVNELRCLNAVCCLDGTKMPKEIDIMDQSGVKNDKTKLGIYELDGETCQY
jgi:hypothetical protein